MNFTLYILYTKLQTTHTGKRNKINDDYEAYYQANKFNETKQN